jgi:hypothetical protein
MQNQITNQRELYREAVIDWLMRNEYNTTEHIIDIIISVLMTRDSVLIGGDFAKAVCNNDLRGVVSKADTEVFENLKKIMSAYHNISIYEYQNFYKQTK